MVQITLEEAATRLPELIREANAGEEVVLTENNLPVAKLITLSSPGNEPKPRARRGGSKGTILYMAPDFDATPEGFEEYM